MKGGKFFTLDYEIILKLKDIENSSSLVNSLLTRYFESIERKELTEQELINKQKETEREYEKILKKLEEFNDKRREEEREKEIAKKAEEYKEQNKERLKEEFIKNRTEWIESIVPELLGTVQACVLAEEYYDLGESRVPIINFLKSKGYLQ